MNGIGHSIASECICYSEEVLPGYRDVFFNSIHFKIDPAVFPVQFNDMVHIYDIGPVTTDHLGERPELVLNTLNRGP